MVALSDRLLMTAAEYLAWEQTQEERYEYWDGEVVATSGGTRNHNRISGNFFRILDDALLNRSCEVYIADVKVQVEPGQKYFYPDVVVTCDEQDDDTQFVQFPCLIIEVLSPSTEAIDRGVKFARYRQFTSLQEYVLVQADRYHVEVFRRNDRGQWVLSEYNLEDSLLLESINIEITISELYRQVQFEVDDLAS
ncbi:Uma2 family endonuclease [Chamaesiphon sp. GL140_3_metabinner_50]|uniref:Uma2 family endonuclease n=1 Tax=Chamaesiphon sp. GL140_3_metabinner_50 TaxID=2970812 RepID=UPI0025DF1FDC|nr:Uma2 family endonuclease [Chamaesiphon sp. GL140_3_metabinner_50]